MKFLEKVQICGLRIYWGGHIPCTCFGVSEAFSHISWPSSADETLSCHGKLFVRAFGMAQEIYIRNISFLNLSLQTSWTISQDIIRFCCTLCVDTNVSHVILRLVSHLVRAPPSCTCSKKNPLYVVIWVFEPLHSDMTAVVCWLRFGTDWEMYVQSN